jgi:histidinol phosphatase-like enzyme
MKTFDIDGTLLDYGYLPGGEPLLNHALIDTLLPGEQIALVTNQGGLAFGLMNAGQYPKPEDFVRRLKTLVNALSGRSVIVKSVMACTALDGISPGLASQVAYEVSELWERPPFPLTIFHGRSERKPSPYMLARSRATVYYGDSDEDEKAAANAGIPFVRVERFTSGGGGQPVNLTTCSKCGRDDKVVVDEWRRWCPECGWMRVYYLTIGDVRPPFNSQLWFEHETNGEADEAEMVADWAEENASDTAWGTDRVWVLDKLDDDAAARCYDVRVENVPTWFAYKVGPDDSD